MSQMHHPVSGEDRDRKALDDLRTLLDSQVHYRRLKSDHNVRLCVDTDHVVAGLQGLHQFIGEKNLPAFRKEETLLGAMILTGQLDNVCMLPPHQLELLGLLRQKLKLEDQAMVRQPEAVRRFIRLYEKDLKREVTFDGTELVLGERSAGPETWRDELKIRAFAPFPWYRRVAEIETQTWLHFYPESEEALKGLKESKWFGLFETEFDAVRPTSKGLPNNRRDALAAAMVAHAVERFNAATDQNANVLVLIFDRQSAFARVAEKILLLNSDARDAFTVQRGDYRLLTLQDDQFFKMAYGLNGREESGLDTMLARLEEALDRPDKLMLGKIGLWNYSQPVIDRFNDAGVIDLVGSYIDDMTAEKIQSFAYGAIRVHDVDPMSEQSGRLAAQDKAQNQLEVAVADLESYIEHFRLVNQIYPALRRRFERYRTSDYELRAQQFAFVTRLVQFGLPPGVEGRVSEIIRGIVYEPDEGTAVDSASTAVEEYRRLLNDCNANALSKNVDADARAASAGVVLGMLWLTYGTFGREDENLARAMLRLIGDLDLSRYRWLRVFRFLALFRLAQRSRAVGSADAYAREEEAEGAVLEMMRVAEDLSRPDRAIFAMPLAYCQYRQAMLAHNGKEPPPPEIGLDSAWLKRAVECALRAYDDIKEPDRRFFALNQAVYYTARNVDCTLDQLDILAQRFAIRRAEAEWHYSYDDTNAWVCWRYSRLSVDDLFKEDYVLRALAASDEAVQTGPSDESIRGFRDFLLIQRSRIRRKNTDYSH